jgi:hypothetical protein
MNKKRIVFSIIALWLAIVNCNLPNGQATQEPSPSPAADLAGTLTAMASSTLATASGPTEIMPQATSAIANSPTPCVPNVVANSPVNVRSGPGTAYEPPIGSLPQGASAGVAGKSDDGTWWYIDFPAGAGGHGWVSGSVVTAYCIPSTLASVAAPPLPTAKPTKVPEPTEVEGPTEVPPAAAKPDLYVSEYTWSPVPPHSDVPFHVRIGAYNQGNAPAGAFTVQWWLSTTAPSPTCTWNVASMAAHGGRILECDYTPGGWNNAYPSQVVVDSGGSVDESDEGNNTWSQALQIKP